MTRPDVLVGDVGGTSVRFAVAHGGVEGVSLDTFEKLPGDDFTCFEDAVDTYLHHQSVKPQAALFALAGPVRDNVVQLTNRPWQVGSERLEQRFGFDEAVLVNDFKAMARSVPELSAENFIDIYGGDLSLDKPVLVAGAGTGLGVASLIPTRPGHWRVLSSEGGHAAFAPRSPRESDLRDLLYKDHGYVSNELICSGTGLEPVHKALCALSGLNFSPMSPQEILDAAAKGDPISLEICTLRARTILSAVGDAALTIGATGGIVLAGGVSSRLVDYLRAEDSMATFLERGPQSGYMTNIPIKLINIEAAPLIGAAALYFEDKD